MTAVRKSDWSFIGAFLPHLFSEIYQFFLYLHEDPSFASIIIHEEIDNRVDVVLVLEHDKFHLVETR